MMIKLPHPYCQRILRSWDKKLRKPRPAEPIGFMWMSWTDTLYLILRWATDRQAIRPHTSLTLDVHLMIEQPELYIADFVKAGADLITVHAETCPHLHRVIHLIKEFGVKAGVAINPATPAHVLQEVLPDLDLVLVMTVNPGFGGQAFIERTINKISRVNGFQTPTTRASILKWMAALQRRQRRLWWKRERMSWLRAPYSASRIARRYCKIRDSVTS